MNVYEFDFGMLDRLPVVLKEKKTGKKKKIQEPYINELLAFDIETTNDKKTEEHPEGTDQSWMYIWQLQIGDDVTIFGRTWEEFDYFIHKAVETIGDKRLVIYVHNLAFEFVYLTAVYKFNDSEVFATDSHKVIRCTMYDKIEFRCSYFLTNLSLDAFTKQMGVENKKESGARFDYDKIRYPWTPLSDFEMEYCLNDVKGLVQALRKKMEADGDDLTTIPLTSTGYARRDLKIAMESYPQIKIADMYPDAELYTVLREAFRGGNTLANRYVTSWTEAVPVKNVTSYDMTSSYPNTFMTRPYPMTRFHREAFLDIKTIRELQKEGKAFVCRFGFGDIHLKDPSYPAPYISSSKCRMLDTTDTENTTIWNGRVISAHFFELSITDIDFDIIDSMYEWKFYYISDLYSAEYGMLPKQLKDVVMKYYKVKTELKGIEDDDPQYVYYMNNKERLNAASYGCLVQDPCKNETIFEDGDFGQQAIDDIDKKLNGMKWTSWGLYQWGVWCAAWGRKNLQEGIDAVGHDFVYCDTDSVKFQGNHDKAFKKLNQLAEARAEMVGATAKDRDGVERPMGVWDKEKGYDKPNRFCTLGAKKYVVERPDGSLHLTISGVIKGKKVWDPKENKEKIVPSGTELKKLENFKEGFVFKDFGKTVVTYNTGKRFKDFWIEREGHRLHITDNVYLTDGTYKLSSPDSVGLTDEDIDILHNGILIKYADVKLDGLYTHATVKGDD